MNKTVVLHVAVPAMLLVAGAALGVAVPAIWPRLPDLIKFGTLAGGSTLIVAAIWLGVGAARAGFSTHGGRATVKGDRSLARAGDAGRSSGEKEGGAGGDASVTGNDSVAIGGRGSDAA